MFDKNQSEFTKIALCYDFDGTLSPDYMQYRKLFPALGYDETTFNDFWDEANENAEQKNMDSTLAYMNLLLDKAKEKNIPLTAKFLMECGKSLILCAGVETWFARMNAYALEKGIDLEHYIITSGNEEIIRGSVIKKYLKYVFGCRYAYEKTDKGLEAQKPAAAVNYTNKTQFLFRINKGILNYWQNKELNQYTPQEKKYVPFANMIYIGDGETDVPCMKMVISQGGHSIAVFNPEKGTSVRTARDLHHQKRVNFIAPTDYTENSKLDKIIKNIIDEIYLKQVD